MLLSNKDHHEGLVTLRFLDMLRKELRLILTVGPNPEMDYRPALDWIVQGRIDVGPIVSHVLPFEQIQEAFTMAFDDPEPHQALKVVLKFN